MQAAEICIHSDVGIRSMCSQQLPFVQDVDCKLLGYQDIVWIVAIVANVTG